MFPLLFCCVYLRCTVWWFDTRVNGELAITIQLISTSTCSWGPGPFYLLANVEYPGQKTTVTRLHISSPELILHKSNFAPLHLTPTSPHGPLPQPPAPSIRPLPLWVWWYQIPHTSDTTEYLSVCIWLISLSILFPGSTTHTVPSGGVPLFTHPPLLDISVIVTLGYCEWGSN